jgi:hypothetical protein
MVSIPQKTQGRIFRLSSTLPAAIEQSGRARDGQAEVEECTSFAALVGW